VIGRGNGSVGALRGWVVGNVGVLTTGDPGEGEVRVLLDRGNFEGGGLNKSELDHTLPWVR